MFFILLVNIYCFIFGSSILHFFILNKKFTKAVRIKYLIFPIWSLIFTAIGLFIVLMLFW